MSDSYHQHSSTYDGTDATFGSFNFRIENATSTWTELYSQEHDVGGFLWKMEAIRSKTDGAKGWLSCFLICIPWETNVEWSCTAKVKLSIIGTHGYEKEFTHTFRTSDEWGFSEFIPWNRVLKRGRGMIVNDAITLRADIKITSSHGGPVPKCRLSMFDETSSHSDVVLIVEGKNIHASKSTLAMYSTFFDTLFFGEFNENGKAEVTLGEDIHYDEFVDFLKVIYPERKKVNEDNVGHLLKLADRFDSLEVRRKCEKFLLKTDKIPTSRKLLFADKYQLKALLSKTLDSFTTSRSVLDLNCSPDFLEYPESLVMTLFKRAATLK